MVRPDWARRGDTVPVQSLPNDQVAIDCLVDRLANPGRSERRTLGIEDDGVLIGSYVCVERDLVRAFERVESIGADVVQHVEMIAQHFGPCGTNGWEGTHRDSIDDRARKVIVIVRQKVSWRCGAGRLEWPGASGIRPRTL